MSRTVHVRPSDADQLAPVRRGQRVGRPPIRRTGTRAAVIAAALAEYGEL